MQQIENAQQIDQAVVKLTEAVDEACKLSIPPRKSSEVLKIPWWTEELTRLKKTTVTYRRKIRNAAPHNRDRAVREYLAKKEEYELKAKTEQVSSWKTFCSKQDLIGRTASREEDLPLTKNGQALNNRESATYLAETFYPQDTEEQEKEHHRHIRTLADRVNQHQQEEQIDPPFTLTEFSTRQYGFMPQKSTEDALYTLVHRIKGKMELKKLVTLVSLDIEGAFDSAWWPAIRVRLAEEKCPVNLRRLLDSYLEHRSVKLRYAGEEVERSTNKGCVQGSIGGPILWNLLLDPLLQELEKRGHYVQAFADDVILVFDGETALEIETEANAALLRVLDSYLEHRGVKVRYAGEEIPRSTNKGCVQGSIGGPILWNLLLDPLLHELERRGYYVQAFADDVVMLFDGNTALEIEREANTALRYIEEWGAQNKLRFAPHKTCAMILTRKLKFDNPRLKMGGVDIALSKQVKILGLYIDNKLTFNTHVGKQTAKALDIYKQVAKAAKINWGLHPEIIRLIYVATIEPIILYAASVWAPAADKIGVQKLLNSVQRGFAQKLCKSYRTVSLHSALTLAGILPLDLRIQEAAALYETKRGSPLPELGDRETESRVGFAETPHPALHMDIIFERLEDQSLVDRHNVQEVRIFTDGSKIEGKVGAALSVWKGESEVRNQKFSLSAYCTVYQAELLAICRATGGILKGRERSYGLYSDSMAALETVANHSSLHPLAVESRENLRKALIQGKDVSLFWIKAHAGLQGNERADELAKEAALALKRKPDYDRCPISFAKRTLRNRSIIKWNDRYKIGETASITKLFFPDASVAYRLVRKIRPAGMLTQILTGHGGFSQYLHRFKCGENPSCDCDPDVEQNVPHLLSECPIFNNLRYDFEQKYNEKITKSKYHDLLGSKSTSNAFIGYCEQIYKNETLECQSWTYIRGTERDIKNDVLSSTKLIEDLLLANPDSVHLAPTQADPMDTANLVRSVVREELARIRAPTPAPAPSSSFAEIARTPKVITPSVPNSAPPKSRPAIIGVPESIPTEELTGIITGQNDSIKAAAQSESDLVFKFKRANRNKNLYNAVFIASPSVWTAVIRANKVNLDHLRIHAEEYVPVLHGHTRAPSIIHHRPHTHHSPGQDQHSRLES
ncbi:hypothetical protein ABMA27_016296 [Loxostege sticticalis]|uniref:Retrovirus-related Pol polyprotein from type-1 retrotransposable element R1 n=1 Tax=Loxostege sticticalis TaxID=481309 RepID=A0ABR3I1R5_LOXSC